MPDTTDPAAATEASKRPGFASTTIGILGFVAALGAGFYVGKWIKEPKAPPVRIERGERYDVELRGDEPVKGPDDALVTIVEFTDFQCPFCAKADRLLDDVLDSYDDDVRLIYKHYPLTFHARAMPAARAAWAAHQQGKFWEMHDWLYDQKGDLSGVQDQVEALGLDWDRFTRDMASEAAAKEIDDDFLAGGLVGVTGTPAFVVNGRFYRGSMPTEHWEAIVEAELEVARALVEDGVARADAYAELMKDAKKLRNEGKKNSRRPPSEREQRTGAAARDDSTR
jgi:protein-disulfide isomerase